MKSSVGFCVQVMLEVVSVIFYGVNYERYVLYGGYFW